MVSPWEIAIFPWENQAENKTPGLVSQRRAGPAGFDGAPQLLRQDLREKGGLTLCESNMGKPWENHRKMMEKWDLTW